jgi:hypothetical protein
MGNILAHERTLDALNQIEIMRRRIMATAISIAEAPRPSGIEPEILSAIDARQKLQAAIEAETGKRDDAEVEFARAVAREISASQVVNVDVVVQRDQAAKTAAERAKQRIEALGCVLEKINTRIEQLKTESPDVVAAVLTAKIETLEEALYEQEETEKGLESQIKLLKAEVGKLPKGAVKKAS